MLQALKSPRTRLASGRTRLIELDANVFREKFNRRQFLFQHHLSDLSLFHLPRLIELARNTANTRPDDLYYDMGVQEIGQRWGAGPTTFPVDETINRIQNVGAWVVLKRADTDPSYRAVL